MTLSPNMRLALAHLAKSTLGCRPPDLPGGHGTVRALVRRGLITRNGDRLTLTVDGRREAER